MGGGLDATSLGVLNKDFKMIRYVFILNFLLFPYSLCQDLSNVYYFSFQLFDAKVDSSLDNSIRNYFADDDGSSSLKSISIDLNNDGINEKLIPNEFLCGSGGCPWLVYSLNMKKVIGNIFGNVLYINTKHKNDYNIIEIYSRNGGGKGEVFFYEYSKGLYSVTNKIALHGEQIEEYFDNKKTLKK
jgi:hypothetical protein